MTEPVAIVVKPLETIPMLPELDDMPIPEQGPYFVTTRDRNFVHKKMHFGRVMVPVKEIPTLPRITGGGVLWLDIPPFPLALLAQVWSFFKWANDERKSEAMVDIIWRNDAYGIFVPPQTASAGGVKCLRKAEHYRDAAIVGTIHSHCNMGARHSSTDDHDAEGHDGLHITLGRVSANQPDMDFMVSANKIRWENLKRDEVLPKGKIPQQAHPEWWQRLHEHQEAVEQFRNQSFLSGTRPATPGNYRGYQGSPNYQSGLWDGDRRAAPGKPKAPNQISPFATHAPHELWHLADLILKQDLLPPGISGTAYMMNMDYGQDIITEAIEFLRSLGLNVNVSIYADRKALDDLSPISESDVTASTDNGKPFPHDQDDEDWEAFAESEEEVSVIARFLPQTTGRRRTNKRGRGRKS